MKTSRYKVLLTTFKLMLLSFVLISTTIDLNAQSKLKRTYLKLFYTKKTDGTKNLKALISYKLNKKFTAVQKGTISFYTGTDLDKLIKKVEINPKGEAEVVVPEGLNADSLGFFHFVAKFKASGDFKKSIKEISIKDSWLELAFNQKSEGRTIIVTGFEISSAGDIPLNEEVYIFVPTLFGDMQISKSKLVDGVCQIEFPSDLPGDSIGNLEIIAKIKDSEVYGDVLKTESIPWGIPKQYKLIENTSTKGKLWTHNAPVWMVVTLLILLAGVWSHFGYIMYKMYKIKINGLEKPV